MMRARGDGTRNVVFNFFSLREYNKRALNSAFAAAVLLVEASTIAGWSRLGRRGNTSHLYL